jgi:hypothetical protein
MEAVTPARIMEVAMAFWPAKSLLSAVEVIHLAGPASAAVAYK